MTARLTRSPRALAGSRANKRYPIARRTTWSDLAYGHRQVRAWRYREDAYYWLGLGYRDRYTLSLAMAATLGDAAHGSKPNHAARYVAGAR